MAQLFHIGLTVKNLERSVAFYRDVAEMTESPGLKVPLRWSIAGRRKTRGWNIGW